MHLYPLTFIPRLVEKIWGGRKLQTVLGKPLPPRKPIGESWEIYDFPPGVVENSSDWVSSIVANGPLAGRTLHSLMLERGDELLGEVRKMGSQRQFPLLIKFLDAREDLSVQVHPDEAYAVAHPQAHLKNEAWYVLESDPGARLFLGLRSGTTREQFHAAVRSGSVEQHLGTVPVTAGDCVYLPSGTVHALGAGILAAEVQTPSDTTFRLHDFGRIDASTGKPRKLHIDEALQCVNFADDSGPILKHVRDATNASDQALVRSRFFQMDARQARAGTQVPIPGQVPVILIGLGGTGQVESSSSSERLEVAKGRTILLPTSLQNTSLRAQTDCAWLEVRAGSSRAAGAPTGGIWQRSEDLR